MTRGINTDASTADEAKGVAQRLANAHSATVFYYQTGPASFNYRFTFHDALAPGMLIGSVQPEILPRDPLTYALKQHHEFKATYPAYLLLFRIGENYEAFHDDARVLHTVTDKPLDAQEGKPTRCAVPAFAVEGYLRQLIRAGHRVALCEPTAGATRVMRPRAEGEHHE